MTSRRPLEGPHDDDVVSVLAEGGYELLGLLGEERLLPPQLPAQGRAVEVEPALPEQLRNRPSSVLKRDTKLFMKSVGHEQWCIRRTTDDQYWCALSIENVCMFEGMRERGRPIPAKEWWLRLARSIIANDPRDFRTLGKDLARNIKRKSPFDHGGISRFATGAVDPKTDRPYGVTLEFVEALCTEFTRLPRPVFFPNTYEEAVHMQSVAERYENVVESSTEAAVVPLPQRDDRRRRKRKGDAHAPMQVEATRRRARGA